MSKEKNIIELNGKQYIEYSPGEKIEKPLDTNHIIVIAQRGWIFEGHRNNEVKDKLQLLNASVVRKWSNGKGIGGLCEKSNKSDYMLDPIGTVSFPLEGVIATIDITQW